MKIVRRGQHSEFSGLCSNDSSCIFYFSFRFQFYMCQIRDIFNFSVFICFSLSETEFEMCAERCRSHLEDVYDISWSADNKLLLSGSVDNTAILWDVKKGMLQVYIENSNVVYS